jgi:4-hydroxybenzoate polyprenyltransferase
MHYKSSILAALPPSIAPYVELTRVGYLPGGVLIAYLPVLNSILNVAATSQLPPAQVLDGCLKWVAICWLVLAFGCVVDDIADEDLDRKVERCKSRPMVRGAVSRTAACLFAVSLAAAVGILTHAFFPAERAAHLPVIIVGSMIYPFLKRFTHYALLFLALMYVVNAVCAPGTLGFHILSAPEPALRSNLLLNAAIYVCNVSVETIYMHADLEEDIKTGINSLAVRIHGYSKPVLFALWMAYTGLLLASGVAAHFGPFYSAGAACSALTLFLLVERVDLKNGKMCEVYFFAGNAVVMGTLALGLFAEYRNTM